MQINCHKAKLKAVHLPHRWWYHPEDGKEPFEVECLGNVPENGGRRPRRRWRN